MTPSLTGKALNFPQSLFVFCSYIFTYVTVNTRRLLSLNQTVLRATRETVCLQLETGTVCNYTCDPFRASRFGVL